MKFGTEKDMGHVRAQRTVGGDQRELPAATMLRHLVMRHDVQEREIGKLKQHVVAGSRALYEQAVREIDDRFPVSLRRVPQRRQQISRHYRIDLAPRSVLIGIEGVAI